MPMEVKSLISKLINKYPKIEGDPLLDEISAAAYGDEEGNMSPDHMLDGSMEEETPEEEMAPDEEEEPAGLAIEIGATPLSDADIEEASNSDDMAHERMKKKSEERKKAMNLKKYMKP
jgi:hypothetical protein